MNRLIWKELVQYRWAPAGYAALLLSVLFAEHAFHGVHRFLGYDDAPELAALQAITVVFLVLAGLYPGSSMISAEVGRGTLDFLMSLPIGRARMWLVKYVAGLAVTAAIIVAAYLAYAAFVCSIFGTGALTASYFWIDKAVVCVLIIYSYSAAFFFSTMADRPLTAGALALATSAAQLMASVVLTGPLNHFDWFGALTESNPAVDRMGPAIYGLAIPALTTASLLAFLKGDSMRSARHIIIGVSVLACWAVVGGVAVVAATRQAERSAAEHHRQMEAVTHNDPTVSTSFLDTTDPRSDDRRPRPWRISVCSVSPVTIGQEYHIKIPLEQTGPLAPGTTVTGVKGVDDNLSGTVHRDASGAFYVDMDFHANGPEDDDIEAAALLNSAGGTVGFIDVKATEYEYRPLRSQ